MADNLVQPAYIRSKRPTEEKAAISLWLYAAGLVVTLVGVSTVSYGFGDPSFTVLTVGLSVIGYIFSIMTRKLNLRIQAVQAPAFILLALALVALVSSGNFTSLIIPDAASKDKLLMLQTLIVWVAVLQSYTLTSDSTVLFACVPCMTSLSLMSVRDTDPVIQQAFLVFISAATFLMVHDNYLQTLRSRRLCRITGSKDFFLGQMGLAVGCLIGSLMLANVVQVPIQALGTTLFGNVATPDGNRAGLLSSLMPGLQVTEHHHIALATGPTANSDVPVMQVNTSYQGTLYWQGATYTVFTGRSFINPDTSSNLLRQIPSSDQGMGYGYAQEPLSVFHMVPQILDLPDKQMQDSTVIRQQVSVTGGSFSTLYGADKIERIQGSFSTLAGNSGGTIFTNDHMNKGTTYTVFSRVACQDPAKLRQAPSGPGDFPQPVPEMCLQTSVNDVNDSRLQQLANSITKGLTNEYDKASAIRQYISSHCDYNLNAPAAPHGVNVVDYFMFNSHQGYCDLFAAAMVVLCRYAGIPARLASGFLEGDPGSNGVWVVRASQKHLWAEVFFPHYGWINFDATGGSKDITKHTAAPGTNTSFLKWIQSNGPVPVAAVILVCGILLYVLKVEILDKLRTGERTRRGKATPSSSQIIASYFAVVTALEKHGIRRPPNLTSTEFAAQVATKLTWTDDAYSEALFSLTAAFERAAYGAHEADTAELESARSNSAMLVKVLTAQDSRRVLNTRSFAWS